MKKLGAAQYVDSALQNTVEELVKLGGAKVILATIASGKAMNAVLGAVNSPYLNERACLISDVKF
jgi:D-arabinose 1-dehydrogenase-like Zn-dependent alcohol dehydrogenase